MGQGYSSVTVPVGLNTIDNTDLSDLHIEKPLGAARFLRSSRARHQNGIVVVKACMKANQTISFANYAKKLREQRKTLKGIPNVLAYQRIRETATLGVLVRQYIYTSLYDRLSIRPFLEGIEKKWIAFQLLCAVRDCHARNVFHGDIKSENVLVTSWGWVYLTDFASAFKPVYLPEDNPADFSFYYDTSARRTCYLAPERFLASGERPCEDNVVQWNMDIFSVGCVLAELFTETPTFTLSQLFRYRKGQYDPTAALLSKIDDDNVRSLISNMIRLDPGERWHAQDYLDEYKGKAFPLYFYNHLHTLLEEITDPTSGRVAPTNAGVNNAVPDDRIDRVYFDFEMLSVSLGYRDTQAGDGVAKAQPFQAKGLFPLQVDLPNSRHSAHSAHPSHDENGTFILLNVITSSLRSSARSASKLRACELLLAFAERLPDEAKLDRVLPYIIALLEDGEEMVLVSALRTMTQLLALVGTVSPANTNIFNQYVFPRLQVFVKTPGFVNNPLVRATYAACLASLAETATRYLDVTQALKTAGAAQSTSNDGEDTYENRSTSHDAYDNLRSELLLHFENQTKIFLTDTDNAVRRAFLTSVPSLCVLFGQTRASDVILTHLNTYLNDEDWLLKCAFFKTITGVAVFIGAANLEEFLLPLMLQALADPQEFVVEQAIRSLAIIAELGLLQRSKTWELIDTVARFQMHPNLWIKEASVHFVSAATTWLSTADVRILTAPLIQPYLKITVGTLSELEILDALKKPLPRPVLDLALQWATKVEKGVFWKPAKESRQLSYRSASHMPPRSSVTDLGPKALAKVPKTVEDEQWLGRLRNAGMRTEDEMKILAFREYLWRTAQRTLKRDGNKRNDRLRKDTDQYFEQIVSLTKLDITPHTVLFDEDVQAYEQHLEAQDKTIAEALEEASHPVRSKARNRNGLNGASESQSEQGNVRQDPLTIGEARTLLAPHVPHNLSSSPNSGLGLLGKAGELGLRSKSSVSGLLNGTGIRNKSRAEVATDDSTASGRLDLPASPGPRAKSPASDMENHDGGSKTAKPTRLIHNYAGNDPAVLKLLDTVYVDRFPVETAEFGPTIHYKSGTIPKKSGSGTPDEWRPQCELVAVLSEHSSRVNRLLPAPDHRFFLTASDDGSVKVWDVERLERNITHRSRQTYRLAPGARVTTICFIHSTHSFVCTGSDGSIHVVRIDTTETKDGLKFAKPRAIRHWQIPSVDSAAEYAVWSDHRRSEKGSLLVLATNLGRILVIDVRTTNLLYDIRIAASHGEPTAFCLGRRLDWLLVGTSHGVLELWDLRFQLLLRTMAFADAAPITRLQLHPDCSVPKRTMVCVTGGTGRGEISTWDIEKMICHEVFRVPRAGIRDRMELRTYELRNLDDDKEKADSHLNRVISSEPSSSTDVTATLMTSVVGMQIGPTGRINDRDKKQSATAVHTFIVTGGPDNKVRFWDCENLHGCRLVNGGAPHEKPVYTASQLGLDIKVFTDKPAENAGTTGHTIESNKISPSPRKSGKDAAASSRVPSRYETIRLSAQNLLTAHLDTITDVAVLERPFGMVLSADRSGRVFAYQ